MISLIQVSDFGTLGPLVLKWTNGLVERVEWFDYIYVILSQCVCNNIPY